MNRTVYIVISIVSLVLLGGASVGLYNSTLDSREWFLVSAFLGAMLLLCKSIIGISKSKQIPS